MELIRKHTHEGPVVVAAVFVRVLWALKGALQHAGISCDIRHGGKTSDEKDAAVERMNRGEIQVLLVSVGSSGVGISLAKSHRMIILDQVTHDMLYHAPISQFISRGSRSLILQDLVPCSEVQMIARIYRMGQVHQPQTRVGL